MRCSGQRARATERRRLARLGLLSRSDASAELCLTEPGQTQLQLATTARVRAPDELLTMHLSPEAAQAVAALVDLDTVTDQLQLRQLQRNGRTR